MQPITELPSKSVPNPRSALALSAGVPFAGQPSRFCRDIQGLHISQILGLSHRISSVKYTMSCAPALTCRIARALKRGTSEPRGTKVAPAVKVTIDALNGGRLDPTSGRTREAESLAA